MQRAPSAPDLFFLRGESIELSAACGAHVSSLIGARAPGPAVAVWRPRAPSAARLGIQLKLFNQSFLDLCDAVSFADSSVASVFPSSPVFLTEETASASHASWERLLATLDGLHAGEAQQGAHAFVHISLLGRMRPVWMELYAFADRTALTEILMVETPLGEDFPLADLLPPPAHQPSLQDSLSLAGSAPLRPASPASAAPSPPPPLETLWTPSPLPEPSKDADWQPGQDETKAAKRAPKTVAAAARPRGGFRCTECGTRETTQKRRGPCGPNTLCNRCGLRWKKQQTELAKAEQEEAAAEAATVAAL